MADTPSPLTQATAEGLRRLLDGDPSVAQLDAALRYLAKWRSALLDNTLAQQTGTKVQDGPLTGMA